MDGVSKTKSVVEHDVTGVEIRVPHQMRKLAHLWRNQERNRQRLGKIDAIENVIPQSLRKAAINVHTIIDYGLHNGILTQKGSGLSLNYAKHSRPNQLAEQKPSTFSTQPVIKLERPSDENITVRSEDDNGKTKPLPSHRKYAETDEQRPSTSKQPAIKLEDPSHGGGITFCLEKENGKTKPLLSIANRRLIKIEQKRKHKKHGRTDEQKPSTSTQPAIKVERPSDEDLCLEEEYRKTKRLRSKANRPLIKIEQKRNHRKRAERREKERRGGKVEKRNRNKHKRRRFKK
ncbi:hypothetical protein PPYR_11768 [Photinus pyralis]|uniref:Uncharacterized protein n=2 Tax=Photinus pyralis TaxID=7054 RepID=A0A5N4ACB0_PHOPY|nr:hypothetical protein PPYR_11768 [Photinus pyralis]